MRAVRKVAGFVGVAMIAWACAKVPYTGRTQFNLVPDGIMTSIGKMSYGQMLQGKSIERRSEDANLLSQVGGRIARVANKPNYDWSYALIEEDTVNAWCLPGGYIGFYTAILPVLRNEAGMAFVMGHEVGHATARHGAERVSQQLALLGGLGATFLFLDQSTDLTPQQNAAIMAGIGLGLEVGVLLPFSRKHESEADVIGMMYAASAGYPPGEGIELWDRMERIAGPSGVPAFLSTHPSNDRRQEVMREWMPQARKRYDRNALGHDTLEARWTETASTGGRRNRGGASNDAGNTDNTDNTGNTGNTGGSDGGMSRPR
jgi:predicted Zn-dependent protease